MIATDPTTAQIILERLAKLERAVYGRDSDGPVLVPVLSSPTSGQLHPKFGDQPAWFIKVMSDLTGEKGELVERMVAEMPDHVVPHLPDYATKALEQARGRFITGEGERINNADRYMGGCLYSAALDWFGGKKRRVRERMEEVLGINLKRDALDQDGPEAPGHRCTSWNCPVCAPRMAEGGDEYGNEI